MSLPNEKKYTKEDYYAVPEDIQAELIEGNLIYAQATPNTNHQAILGELFISLSNYIKKNKGKCRVFPAPFSVELSDETIVEPDISVICDPNKITFRGCVGAPDFIIEITSTNARNDYLVKTALYERYGVREYWIVNPTKQTITVYHFEKDIVPQSFTFVDVLKVNIYGDLFIDFNAIKDTLI